jgi:hypothetical protein
VSKKILLKRGTEANLPSLDNGEPGWATDTKEFYVGDGDGSPVKINYATLASLLSAYGLDSSLATFALPDNTTISAFGKTLVAATPAASALSVIGGQALNATLTLLSALGLGTANTKMFTNAPATGAEWSTGMNATNHTYDLATESGAQSLTGAGFTPSGAIALYGMAPGGTATGAGIGMKFGAVSGCLQLISAGAILGSIDDSFMLIVPAAGNYQLCSLAFTSDGGTLTWTKNASPTGTMTFKVFWLR